MGCFCALCDFIALCSFLAIYRSTGKLILASAHIFPHMPLKNQEKSASLAVFRTH